jgi:molybdate transport system substrate-binding protein
VAARWRRCRFAAVLVLLATAGAGCDNPSATHTNGGGGDRAADPLTGKLTVLAAASLTDAFEHARTALLATHPGLAITNSFAGSQTLVTQVENGAPADVIATADTATMQRLVADGLVDVPRVFARNRLEIVVAPGNPKHVSGLADLGRGNLKVVLEDPSVPAGRYGRQALQRRGTTVRPVSLPLDVRSELLAVEQGNADAGIVYVTDVSSAGAAVSGVPIPDSENVIATYPVAVVRATTNRDAAQAFVDALLDGAGRQALVALGFVAP